MDLDRPVTPNPYDLLPAVASFSVTSDDVTDGQPLKDDQVAAEGNTSPQLSWDAVDGAQSYTVTCFDPDAPTPSGFWHWVLVDLPADVTSLDAGAGAEGADLPGSAFHCRHDGGGRDQPGLAHESLLGSITVSMTVRAHSSSATPASGFPPTTAVWGRGTRIVLTGALTMLLG